jgi:hypothetical protein
VKINYGINRRRPQPLKRSRIEHKCGSLEMDGDWNCGDFHKRIRHAIYQAHPGWSITGYALASKPISPYVCSGCGSQDPDIHFGTCDEGEYIG